MKKRIALIAFISGVVLLTGCGAKGGAKGGYVPTSIEQVSSGGVVASGCEAKKSLEPSDYHIESFWGKWVPEEEISSKKTFTVSYPSSPAKDNNETKLFPSNIDFEPWWEDPQLSSFDFEYISMGYMVNSLSDDVAVVSEDGGGYEDTMYGQVCRNIGFGFGSMGHEIIPKDPSDAMFVFEPYEFRYMAYQLSGDTLCCGLMNVLDNDTIELYEIDYKVSFDGYRLTLSSGSESVTYIPEDFEAGPTFNLSRNGTISDTEPYDGIIGLSINDNAKAVLTDYHIGYVDTDIVFLEDNTVSITKPDGTVVTCPYLASKQSLTLVSDAGSSVYTKWNYAIPSLNKSLSSALYTESDMILIKDSKTIQDILDLGFSTDASMSTVLQPCQVSDLITLSNGTASLKVRSVNVYSKPMDLGSATLCYAYIDGESGEIHAPNNVKFGETTREMIEKFYLPAFEQTKNSLKYKAEMVGISSITYMSAFGDSKGQKMIEADEAEGIYKFDDNGYVVSFELQIPSLMYNGLQDSISEEEFNTIDNNTMQAIVATKEDILTMLSNAFETAGINAEINQGTGEVTMDSSILFDVDSSELSASGKTYLDSLMKAYGSVILDDSLSEIICGVIFEGHTDSTGGYEYNMTLSEERAKAVLDYCLTSSGLDSTQAARLKSMASSVGYSYSKLIFDENGVELPDESRRVTIKFKLDPKAAAEGANFSGGTLNTDDFSVIWGGDVYDLFATYGNEGGFLFVNLMLSDYDDFMTYRGAKRGDSVDVIMNLYGDTDWYNMNESIPLTNISNYKDALLSECDSCVVYTDGTNDLWFCFDSQDKLNWIAYAIIPQ